MAKLIAHMKPPPKVPSRRPASPATTSSASQWASKTSRTSTTTCNCRRNTIRYVRYPTIVTLNGAGTTAEQQIDWWAGDRAENGSRLGQATRLGYIVVAVDWLKEGQRGIRVLGPRARRRAGQPARRLPPVFDRHRPRIHLRPFDRRQRRLGHGAGASGSVGRRDSHRRPVRKILHRCTRNNANLVPFYVLCGELDGDKVIVNAPHLERYMNKGFDVTVVEYLGRGHEDFHDDIQNIFDWMNRRDAAQFLSQGVHRLHDAPLGQLLLVARGRQVARAWHGRPGQLASGSRSATGADHGQSAGHERRCRSPAPLGGVTVWLSPEAVDFNRPMKISLNNSSITKSRRIEPDLSVLLEDVRTRGDRLHAFWAKVEH